MGEPETGGSKIQNLLQRIREKSSQGEYIYRGESEHHEKIASGLYRKYKDGRYKDAIQAKEFDIQIAQKEMLKQVKAYTDFTDETDVLTELQHYGGKTNLIDFTTDYLIALFFACDGSPNEDGRIILLNKNSNQGTISSPKKNQNNRVISQKSIFLQSPKGYLDEEDSTVEIISIPKEMKQPLLDYLRKYHGITTHTIYNDLFGYIQNQEKHQPAYAEFYIGLTSYQKGEYEDAIKHYDQAIDINPQFAEAYNNRGITKDRLGRHEEAITDYNEAIRINPQLAEAYYNRGTTKDLLGRHEEAIADYDQAIRINPQYAEAYYNRGNAKGELDRHEEAIADYDQAIRINPQYAQAYCNRGTAKNVLGGHKDAIVDYNEAIRINPKIAKAYCGRGIANIAIEEYEKARADLQRAFELATEQGNQKFAQAAQALLDQLPPAGSED